MVPAVTPDGPASRADGPPNSQGRPDFTGLLQFSSDRHETRIFGYIGSNMLQKNCPEQEIRGF